jgi:hypothetical protein
METKENSDRIYVVQHPLGMVADVREEHLLGALARLNEMSRAERRRVMKSVNCALENTHRLQVTGYASEKDLQDAASDVGIWFANEIREGRVNLGKDNLGPDSTPEDFAKFREWHSRATVEDTLKVMERRRHLRQN